MVNIRKEQDKGMLSKLPLQDCLHEFLEAQSSITKIKAKGKSICCTTYEQATF